MPTRLLICLGLTIAAGCSAPSPTADAGPPDAGELPDAGGGVDAGESDAGMPGDAGVDAGCGSADRLTFTTAPQTIDARACSGALRVQLTDGCGAAVSASQPIVVAFAASSSSTEVFGDGQCIGKPSEYRIPAGSSYLDVFFSESAPTTTTITASAAGLMPASQLETTACAAGEKICNTSSCIPTASCCTDADCTAPTSKCKATGDCTVPPCSGFVNGCSSYVAYSTPITFGSSGYSPPCVHASSGTSITFSGDFFFHPLEQTCGPSELTVSGFGSTRTVKTGGFGDYGFRCKSHPTFEKGALRSP